MNDSSAVEFLRNSIKTIGCDESLGLARSRGLISFASINTVMPPGYVVEFNDLDNHLTYTLTEDGGRLHMCLCEHMDGSTKWKIAIDGLSDSEAVQFNSMLKAHLKKELQEAQRLLGQSQDDA